MTVEEIRKIPIGPSASEVVFPDRASIAVFDADAVLALSEEGLAETAMRFYNDTFSMDQNACACPRAVFWREELSKNGRSGGRAILAGTCPDCEAVWAHRAQGQREIW